MKYD